MKTVEVETLVTFIDRESDMRQRQPGEIFEAKPERAKYLENLGFVQPINKTVSNSKD